jgi:isopentenyl diphosphate isomerase/L-lactate dehydrogenase-like FMN-dependent dehydrogenase
MEEQKILDFKKKDVYKYEAEGINDIYTVEAVVRSLKCIRLHQKKLNNKRYKLRIRPKTSFSGQRELGEYPDFITAVKTAENYELRMNKRAA